MSFFFLRGISPSNVSTSCNFVPALSLARIKDTRSLNFFNCHATFELCAQTLFYRSLLKTQNYESLYISERKTKKKKRKEKKLIFFRLSIVDCQLQKCACRLSLAAYRGYIGRIFPNLITEGGSFSSADRYPSRNNPPVELLSLKRGPALPTGLRNFSEGVDGRRARVEYRHDNRWFVLILAGVYRG